MSRETLGAQRGGTGARVIVLDADAYDAAAAVEIERALRAACKARDRAAVAVSGGGTPRPVYRSLATRESIDWSRIDVYFADERCVPPDDPESNYQSLRETLLEPLGSRAPFVERMLGEEADATMAAEHYADRLPARLDLVVLGVGADGHTASLFPGDREALESTEFVRAVVGAKPPPRRLTLTPRAFRLARERIVLVRGRDKAGVVKAVLEGRRSTLELPAAIARDAIWILDDESAATLSVDDETKT